MRRVAVLSLLALLVALVTTVAGLTGPGPGGAPTPAAAQAVPRVLVFTRAEEFVHGSIPHAVDVLGRLGRAGGFDVEATEDPAAFTPEHLARFAAVVFLSTTGDVLDPPQEAAFEAYIRAGGGFVGIHAAADTEYDWPWYGQLVGAWFKQHPPGVHRATVVVEDPTDPSTAFLPERWTRTDEWYDFLTNPRDRVHVLATLDESTYTGGTMGADHPIAWCHRFDGGRSWYTAGGHTQAAFDEDRFRQHLREGIRWAAGLQPGCGDPGGPPPTDPPPPGNGGVDPGGVGEASRFVPVQPARVLDTRVGLGGSQGPVPSDGTIDVAVAGQAGVPANAVAVALNLTATEATGAGYVTAWPTGEARPSASNLNLERAGQTIPNFAVVRLGAGGAVSLYAQTSTHLLADVTGYWVPSGPARAGRLVPVQPARLLDTREGLGAPAGPVPSEGTIELEVAGRAGVPASGVQAVALNVTATDTTGPGYVAVWPDGERPLVSNLNAERAGQTIPNFSLVPVGADGRIRLYAQAATHLVVDVAGWITGAGAPVSDAGLFVPLSPARLLDTRTVPQDGGFYGPAALLDGTRADLAVAGNRTVPASGVGAVVVNVTATEATAPGYVSVFPAATAAPLASNLNVTEPGQTIANLVVARLGHEGRVSLLAQHALDLVVDAAGYFTGTPASPDPGEALTPPGG